jgi:Gas vesicle synthesis protein GvpL/GvpF
MIYLYGLTRPLQTALNGTGLDGAPLQAEAVESLTVVYSTHDELEVRADAESCWAHERAVEAVMDTQAVLPARFGTTFPDLGELRTAVLRDATALEQRLDQIEGCVELAVRINPLGSPNGPTANGRRYLLDKLSAQRRREALAESTLACLREFAVDSRLATSVAGGDTVSISYLVKAGGVERFSRAVSRLQRRWPEFALSCTGPWAPYSFVNGPREGVA